MKFAYELPAVLIGVAATVAIIQPQMAVALSADEVSRIAKSITVRIESKNPGSGVIIKRDGNTYTVLTAAHVVERAGEYTILMNDDSRYPLNYSTVKKLSGVDLAIVQFTSSKTYTVAKIGNSDDSTEGKAAYVAGFPVASAAINRSIYQFTDGKITANASQPLKDGYALVYSNNTLPGMSGGPVLNDKGEVIGVHGRADTTVANSDINSNVAYLKTNFNLGIPINTFLRMSLPVGVDVGVRAPSVPVRTAPTAGDFFIQGGDKFKKGDYQGALAAYMEAIRLNPNYVDAYNNRGLARYQLGNKQGAIEDYNQVIRLNPNYASAYNNRGLARDDIGDRRGAIEDYNQGIRLNPNDPSAYINRGLARDHIGDQRGAIEDYNQAIRLNPNNADAYNNRGTVRSQQGDQRGAIEDYNQAIRLNPNYAAAVYLNRGNARQQLGDRQGAIEDYNQVIRLDPNYDRAYALRGLTRFLLKDWQSAFEDCNHAIRLNPNIGQYYTCRGSAYSLLGNRQAAIADIRRAAYLFRQQGNTSEYEKAMELLRILQR